MGLILLPLCPVVAFALLCAARSSPSRIEVHDASSAQSLAMPSAELETGT